MSSICHNPFQLHHKMSAHENAVIEEAAKFEGFKELLEDDMEDTEPDSSVYDSVRENQSEIKKQYLNLKVAQAKYKSKFVPAAVTEAEFNDKDSPYKYSDGWMELKKKEYQTVQKAASAFLKLEQAGTGAVAEQKVKVAAAEEITKVVAQITMESGQVENCIDDTYKRLQTISEINPSQAQVYKDLQGDLMKVIDVKIPELIKKITELAGPSDEQALTKLNKDFAAFESKEKTRLYRLVQLIAEKTSFPVIQTSVQRASSGRSEAIHLKKVDPPFFFWQGGRLPRVQQEVASNCWSCQTTRGSRS